MCTRQMCSIGQRRAQVRSSLRMDVAALRRQIDSDAAAGDIPFIVVGTAGTVSVAMPFGRWDFI
jgi:glutamate/tyrosine decarboxylase-like PLP-dependent enzyme